MKKLKAAETIQRLLKRASKKNGHAHVPVGVLYDIRSEILDLEAELEALRERVLVRRRTDDGKMAECPLCGSLDVGAAGITANCYGCGLTLRRSSHAEVIEAWNSRGGKPLPDNPPGD